MWSSLVIVLNIGVWIQLINPSLENPGHVCGAALFIVKNLSKILIENLTIAILTTNMRPTSDGELKYLLLIGL